MDWMVRMNNCGFDATGAGGAGHILKGFGPVTISSVTSSLKSKTKHISRGLPWLQSVICSVQDREQSQKVLF